MGQGGLFLKRQNFFRQHIRDNRGKYLLSALCCVVGVCIGVVGMLQLDEQEVQSLTEFFKISIGDTSLAQVFKNCLLTNAKYLCAYFLMSLSIYTSYLSCMILGAKGFAISFTASFLIKSYKTNGVAYSLFAMLPSALLIIPVHLFATVVCINFAGRRRKNKETGMRTALEVLLPLLIIYVVMTILSLYDVIISSFIFKYMF